MAVNSEKTLHLYVDFMSQPSRAVVIFCRMNKIDAEIHIISLAKGEHRTPQFKAINPLCQVPAIDHNGFKLSESHAILRYLATTFPGVPDHWYPGDTSRRARIDSILDWHHSNLRRGSSGLVFSQVLAPAFGLKKDPLVASQSLNILKSAVSTMEEVWLDGHNSFLGGSLKPSLADLSLACELMQLQFLDAEFVSTIMGSKVKVNKWLTAVETATAPHFTSAHTLLQKASLKFRAGFSKM